MIRRGLGPLLAAATLLILAVPASATPVTIDGSPLNVTVDEFGKLQAQFDGRDTAEFFPPSTPSGNAGFHLSIFDQSGEATLYGPNGLSFTPLDANSDGDPDGPVIQPRGPGDPQRIALTYTAGSELRVDQLIEYRDGDREFTTHHTVTNVSGQPVRFSAAEYADLYLTGSDQGTGFLEAGPPRIVGGINPGRSTGGGIVEVSPAWSAHEANSLSTVGQHLSASTGPALDGTIVQQVVDNAVAVQWDDFRSTPIAPRAEAKFTINWRFGEFEVPPPPPIAGVAVNVDPFGDARVKFPPGFTPPARAGGRAQAAQSGFVPLTRAVQIPVGSVVDVRKGGVEMTSAANLTGRTQSGTFTKGRFKVTQPRTARPFTNLRLTGGSFRACRRDLSRRSTARIAARRVRRLSGRARGRFRTRGRYGSATVRGTTWSVEDRCNGTLTRVSEGVVAVRDFAKRRTVRLRAGRSYLARPRRR
jgi:hypothetical protein